MSRCRSGSRTTFNASSTEPCSTCHAAKNIVHLPRMADADASPNRGVMIVLAYLWPLALVPLLLEKHDPDVQWHARHGLVLMVAELLLVLVYFAVASVVSLASLGLGLVLMPRAGVRLDRHPGDARRRDPEGRRRHAPDRSRGVSRVRGCAG